MLARSSLLAFALASVSVIVPAAASQYQATEASLDTHPVPVWYRDAKLGIFIHWGLYSVPGWAPVGGPGNGNFDNANWFRLNPYAEWYYNSMRIDGSPTQAYHRAHYGADYNYYDFAGTFGQETGKWHPEAWAKLFRETGAWYVVLTTKHHDGYTLWPTAVENPHLAAVRGHSQRDLVGELAKAVRQEGMRMGVYYSGGFDWTFVPGPFHNQKEAAAGTPKSDEYARYADAHYRELIKRYKPDILWNDIRYPAKGKALQLFADYYNTVPEGIVNDRWSPVKHADFTTPEYKNLPGIAPRPWEECRGLGQSFGYNRAEGEKETIKPEDLIHLLVDVVSKNGNLLLDVGPEADGNIPPIQLDRLHALGVWLKQNGEAIYGTRPWIRAEGLTEDGIPIRFTQREQEEAVYAILLKKPTGRTLVLKDMPAPAHGGVTVLGGSDLQWKEENNTLQIELPSSMPGKYAWVLRLK